MAVDLKAFPINWAPTTAGNTYPAENWLETDSDNTTTLVRVVVQINDAEGVSFATLDSDGAGITINVATAGAWDWTVNEIAAAPTVLGVYTQDMTWTDSAGTVFTVTKGKWPITKKE